MFKTHVVIELPQIPRERAELQQVIARGRAAAQKRRLFQTFGTLIVGVLLLTCSCGVVPQLLAGHRSTAAQTYIYYLPIIER